MSNRDEVLRVAKETQDKVGDVTILFNNAGIMPTHPFLEHTKDEVERIMNINVMAHFWVSVGAGLEFLLMIFFQTLEAFLPVMKKQNYGHVVTLSSCAGLLGIPNLVPYCCSKFAVRGMMEALYQEFRQDKKNEVKFTTICPYMVDTGLCKKPVIRFENAMKLVDPLDAAREIMNAQRLELREITIPRYLYYWQFVLRMLPEKAQGYIGDFLSVGLESDLS